MTVRDLQLSRALWTYRRPRLTKNQRQTVRITAAFMVALTLAQLINVYLQPKPQVWIPTKWGDHTENGK